MKNSGETIISPVETVKVKALQAQVSPPCAIRDPISRRVFLAKAAWISLDEVVRESGAVEQRHRRMSGRIRKEHAQVIVQRCCRLARQVERIDRTGGNQQRDRAVAAGARLTIQY